MKYIQIALVSLLLCSVTGLVGCKRDANKVAQEKRLLQIKKWAKPGCIMFYNKMMNLCGDFLKKKKRTVKRKAFLIQCAKKAIAKPQAMKNRFFCASIVKTCGHLRHCSHCARPVCLKWKKGPKVPKFKFPKPQIKTGKKKPKTAPKAGVKKAVPADVKKAAPTKSTKAPKKAVGKAKPVIKKATKAASK